MTDWYKIKRIMIRPNWVEKQVYPGKKVQTFDFQNDWALGWTGYNYGYWTPTIEAHQWWYIWTSTGWQYQGYVIAPSSIFGGTLKKIKIWAYRPSTSPNNAIWIYTSTGNDSRFEYGRENNSIYVNWTKITATPRYWEITIELTFWSSLGIEVSDGTNTDTYNWWDVVAGFQTQWENQNLWLMLGRWIANKCYIRKVEITTKP